MCSIIVGWPRERMLKMKEHKKRDAEYCKSFSIEFIFRKIKRRCGDEKCRSKRFTVKVCKSHDKCALPCECTCCD